MSNCKITLPGSDKVYQTSLAASRAANNGEAFENNRVSSVVPGDPSHKFLPIPGSGTDPIFDTYFGKNRAKAGVYTVLSNIVKNGKNPQAVKLAKKLQDVIKDDTVYRGRASKDMRLEYVLRHAPKSKDPFNVALHWLLSDLPIPGTTTMDVAMATLQEKYGIQSEEEALNIFVEVESLAGSSKALLFEMYELTGESSADGYGKQYTPAEVAEEMKSEEFNEELNEVLAYLSQNSDLDSEELVTELINEIIFEEQNAEKTTTKDRQRGSKKHRNKSNADSAETKRETGTKESRKVLSLSDSLNDTVYLGSVEGAPRAFVENHTQGSNIVMREDVWSGEEDFEAILLREIVKAAILNSIGTSPLNSHTLSIVTIQKKIFDLLKAEIIPAGAGGVYGEGFSALLKGLTGKDIRTLEGINFNATTTRDFIDSVFSTPAMMGILEFYGLKETFMDSVSGILQMKNADLDGILKTAMWADQKTAVRESSGYSDPSHSFSNSLAMSMDMARVEELFNKSFNDLNEKYEKAIDADDTKLITQYAQEYRNLLKSLSDTNQSIWDNYDNRTAQQLAPENLSRKEGRLKYLRKTLAGITEFPSYDHEFIFRLMGTGNSKITSVLGNQIYIPEGVALKDVIDTDRFSEAELEFLKKIITNDASGIDITSYARSREEATQLFKMVRSVDSAILTAETLLGFSGLYEGIIPVTQLQGADPEIVTLIEKHLEKKGDIDPFLVAAMYWDFMASVQNPSPETFKKFLNGEPMTQQEKEVEIAEVLINDPTTTQPEDEGELKKQHIKSTVQQKTPEFEPPVTRETFADQIINNLNSPDPYSRENLKDGENIDITFLPTESGTAEEIILQSYSERDPVKVGEDVAIVAHVKLEELNNKIRATLHADVESTFLAKEPLNLNGVLATIQSVNPGHSVDLQRNDPTAKPMIVHGTLIVLSDGRKVFVPSTNISDKLKGLEESSLEKVKKEFAMLNDFDNELFENKLSYGYAVSEKTMPSNLKSGILDEASFYNSERSNIDRNTSLALLFWGTPVMTVLSDRMRSTTKPVAEVEAFKEDINQILGDYLGIATDERGAVQSSKLSKEYAHSSRVYAVDGLISHSRVGALKIDQEQINKTKGFPQELKGEKVFYFQGNLYINTDNILHGTVYDQMRGLFFEKVRLTNESLYNRVADLVKTTSAYEKSVELNPSLEDHEHVHNVFMYILSTLDSQSNSRWDPSGFVGTVNEFMTHIDQTLTELGAVNGSLETLEKLAILINEKVAEGALTMHRALSNPEIEASLIASGEFSYYNQVNALLLDAYKMNNYDITCK